MSKAVRFVTPALISVLFAGAATAAPLDPRPDYRADGSIKVGGEVFATHAAYYASPTFRDRGARCGSVEPAAGALAPAPSDCSLSHTTINPAYNDGRVLVIQVVFHVIRRTDGVGAITPALIQSQIDILNEDFEAITGTLGAPGTDTQVHFVLAKFDPTGAPTTGIDNVTSNAYFNDPGPGGANAMKQALHWDTSRYLNLYTNDAAGFLGYATFPTEEAGGPEDGVVLLYDSVGRNSPGGPPYNLGRTATHEIGHYLGLLHTFQDGCGSAAQPYDTGDLVSDTVPEASEQFGCSPGPSSCGGGQLPIDDYMDYTDDGCMHKFTVEQSNRIRCSVINFRTVNTAPTAEFTSVKTGLSVAFTSTSTDAESAVTALHYSWDFGDGGTDTTASPNHVYTLDGTYDVTLDIVDPGSATSTVTHQVMVVANSPPDAPPADQVPDADPSGNPDGGGNPGDGGGGGCCQAQGSDASFALCAFPVMLVLRRRRRR